MSDNHGRDAWCENAALKVRIADLEQTILGNVVDGAAIDATVMKNSVLTAMQEQVADLTAKLVKLEQRGKNVLRNVSTDWETRCEDREVVCHSCMIGGVLCRWWGDGPTPEGVAILDARVDLSQQVADLTKERDRLIAEGKS